MNADEKFFALSASALFIISFLPALVGGIMFSGRKQIGWSKAQSRRYLVVERSLWIAAPILLTGGFWLFTDMLQAGGEKIFSRLGLIGFLFGAILIVVVEAQALDTGAWPDYTIRLSVVVTMLAEAIFGVSILLLPQLPQWIGWAMILWNIVGLALLLRAKDPYIPGVYYIMPLIISVVLINLAQVS